ncbi:MAG: hypothetical protein RIC35_02745 [Marinoscillum sp.]
MRILLLTFVIVGLLFVSACDDSTNRLDLNKDPLSGKINGVEWEYTGGNALYRPFDNEATGLILNQETTDPCTIKLTSLAHVQVILPTFETTLNLPDVQNRAVIKMASPNGGPIYTASGGFVQIVEVTGREIIGYISATYDDDNYVQGSFYVKICN